MILCATIRIPLSISSRFDCSAMTVQAPKPAVLSEAVEEAYKKREQERLEETKKTW